jgi:predicted phage tail protein
VYYLLTSKSQGVGNVVPTELIDVESLTIAAQFQRANRIFFDGVVEDSDSLRSFLYDNAALQLCNFTIKNGRFGMMPALPYDSNYEISTSPIAVEQIFTAGNIIEDSLQVQYIDAAQRANFRALVSWRVTIENDLPTQASALVDWADIPEGSRSTTQQAFDLTDFCTNRAQALKTARFLLSIRRRITHTVSFKTVPDALGIQPGSYIRVITAATSYSAANNGIITDAGTLVSISTITDGTYDAMVYNPATSEVLEREITISSGSVTEASLYGTLFTLLSETVNKGVYQVEQLTLDEDGLVNVAAVEVPVDSSGASIVAKDVLSEGSFRVLE